MSKFYTVSYRYVSKNRSCFAKDVFVYPEKLEGDLVTEFKKQLKANNSKYIEKGSKIIITTIIEGEAVYQIDPAEYAKQIEDYNRKKQGKIIVPELIH